MSPFSLPATPLWTRKGSFGGQTKCDTKGIPKDERNTSDWFHSWQLNRRVISKWLQLACSQVEQGNPSIHVLFTMGQVTVAERPSAEAKKKTDPSDKKQQSPLCDSISAATYSNLLKSLLMDICKFFSTEFEGTFAEFVLEDVPVAQHGQIKLDEHKRALNFFLTLVDKMYMHKEDVTESSESSTTEEDEKSVSTPSIGPQPSSISVLTDS